MICSHAIRAEVYAHNQAGDAPQARRGCLTSPSKIILCYLSSKKPQFAGILYSAEGTTSGPLDDINLTSRRSKRLRSSAGIAGSSNAARSCSSFWRFVSKTPSRDTYSSISLLIPPPKHPLTLHLLLTVLGSIATGIYYFLSANLVLLVLSMRVCRS